MSTVLSISKVFQRGKVVIPKEVRERLKIKDGDRILWYLNELGEVCVKKVEERAFREW